MALVSWTRKVYRGSSGQPIIHLPVEFRGLVGKEVEISILGNSIVLTPIEERDADAAGATHP